MREAQGRKGEEEDKIIFYLKKIKSSIKVWK